MAEIILKDLNSNENEYSNVTQIEVPYRDNNGALDTRKFTSLLNAKVYAINKIEGNTYLVKKKLQYIPSQYLVLYALDESEFKEVGDANGSCSFILTTKELEVGNTYALTDVY